jgi:hypothetical protein
MKPSRAAARQAIALEDVVERLGKMEDKIDQLLELVNLSPETFQVFDSAIPQREKAGKTAKGKEA